MIKNFHFKMLIGFVVFSFFMSFIFIAGAFHSKSKELMTPIGIVFSSFGFLSVVTAGALRSIIRRLDAAGIAEDPQFPTSTIPANKRQCEEGVDGDAEEAV